MSLLLEYVFFIWLLALKSAGKGFFKKKPPRGADQLAALPNYADRFHDYYNDLNSVYNAVGTNLTAHVAYASIWDKVATACLEDIFGTNITSLHIYSWLYDLCPVPGKPF